MILVDAWLRRGLAAKPSGAACFLQKITESFDTALLDWEKWFRNNEPEVTALPSDFEDCTELQKMLLVRSLRPDRVIFAANNFVANSLGRKFVEPPVLDLNETYQDSLPSTPLVFVLSAGVDPTDALRKLAAERGMVNNFFAVALGQGQAPIATKLIEDGVAQGNWVFLANCHLMTSWLPKLDKIIEGLEARKPHPNFRLWLSSSPNDLFPIAILQRGEAAPCRESELLLTHATLVVAYPVLTS